MSSSEENYRHSRERSLLLMTHFGELVKQDSKESKIFRKFGGMFISLYMGTMHFNFVQPLFSPI